MLDSVAAGIIDPGVQEYYVDGSVQTVEDDIVHSMLYVMRGEDKVAVCIVHMSRKKHAENVRRIFMAVCSACTSRRLQTILLAMVGG